MTVLRAGSTPAMGPNLFIVVVFLPAVFFFARPGGFLFIHVARDSCVIHLSHNLTHLKRGCNANFGRLFTAASTFCGGCWLSVSGPPCDEILVFVVRNEARGGAYAEIYA